jgi:hypothetical protein
MKKLNKGQTLPEPEHNPAEVRREAPPEPPEDQRFFDESLEAGLRGIGRLMERRRKQK